MRVKYGSVRMALILGSLVIKVPRLRFPTQRLKEAAEALFEGRWREFSPQLGYIGYHFRAVIKQNLVEFRTWRNLRAGFLAPTYFSCGILTIGRYIEGEQPSMQDLLRLWERLSEPARHDFYQVDPHSTLTTENILWTPTGYCFIDYGDSSGELDQFLSRNRAEIEKLLRDR